MLYVLQLVCHNKTSCLPLCFLSGEKFCSAVLSEMFTCIIGASSDCINFPIGSISWHDAGHMDIFELCNRPTIRQGLLSSLFQSYWSTRHPLRHAARACLLSLRLIPSSTTVYVCYLTIHMTHCKQSSPLVDISALQTTTQLLTPLAAPAAASSITLYH